MIVRRMDEALRESWGLDAELGFASGADSTTTASANRESEPSALPRVMNYLLM
jgi:hypothetical protein